MKQPLRLLAALALTSVLAVPALHAQSATPATSVTPTALERPELVQDYQATITPEDLAAYLYVFASDFFEGRETATRGQKLAATYLAGQYRKLGLEPKGTAPTSDPYAPEAYFQPFTVYGQRLEKAQLGVVVDGDTVAASTFTPASTGGEALLAYGNAPKAEGEVVFAGYGIADDELGYNDLEALRKADIDVSGKWLMVLRDEPLADSSASLLPTSDGAPSRWTRAPLTKLSALFGTAVPAGVLVVGDVGPRAEPFAEQVQAATAAARESVGSLSLEEGSGRSRLIPPVYTVSTELANEILAPAERTVEEVKAEIDEELKPVVFEVPDVRVASTVERESFAAQTENVLAYIEGSDPELKDEVVVLSSHYDHIGIDPTLGEDIINNGADDDGSGTVTLLEIAEALMQAKRDGHGPRRSVLFLHVSGEEKGLLGSAYYADVEPVFPIEKTVTNLNIDMIGRFDPTHPTGSEDYVYIIGSSMISQELHDLNAGVNEATGIDLELDERFNSKDDPNRFYARSDHWNFGKQGVPFIFYFTGTHEDYHGPDDEADKVEYERMARIGRLILATAWQVANQDEPPAVSGKGFN